MKPVKTTAEILAFKALNRDIDKTWAICLWLVMKLNIRQFLQVKVNHLTNYKYKSFRTKF